MIGEIAGLKEAVGREQPEWISPMLAILTDRRFSDPNWIYERKLDGERVLSFKKDGEVRLMSRNRKQIGSSYPEVVDALSSLDLDDFIADGEMVAFDGRLTSFQKLQGRMHLSGKRIESSKVEVFYYLFDLMFLDDHDLREVPLRRRKSLLKSVIDWSSDGRNGSGAAIGLRQEQTIYTFMLDLGERADSTDEAMVSYTAFLQQGISPGDRIGIDTPLGNASLTVTGVVDDTIAMVYVNESVIADLIGETAFSGAYVIAAENHIQDAKGELLSYAMVANVQI